MTTQGRQSLQSHVAESINKSTESQGILPVRLASDAGDTLLALTAQGNVSDPALESVGGKPEHANPPGTSAGSTSSTSGKLVEVIAHLQERLAHLRVEHVALEGERARLEVRYDDTSGLREAAKRYVDASLAREHAGRYDRDSFEMLRALDRRCTDALAELARQAVAYVAQGGE